MSRRFMPPIHQEKESSHTPSRPKPKTSDWLHDRLDSGSPYGGSSSISVQTGTPAWGERRRRREAGATRTNRSSV